MIAPLTRLSRPSELSHRGAIQIRERNALNTIAPRCHYTISVVPGSKKGIQNEKFNNFVDFVCLRSTLESWQIICEVKLYVATVAEFGSFALN